MKLEILSKIDPLTGLYNRRSMIEAMEQKVIEYNGNSTFSIIMADIDHFKMVNDTFGHDVGDKVLKILSNVMATSTNNGDLVSRWGGEEFLILINNTLEETVILTENIRFKILNNNIDLDGTGRKLSMTFGVSEYKQTDTVDELIKRADNALYQGKKTGRNKIAAF